MDSVRKTLSEDRYMSVNQAARQIGKAYGSVLSLIVAGELDGERVAGRTVVTRDSVERYKQRAATVAASE